MNGQLQQLEFLFLGRFPPLKRKHRRGKMSSTSSAANTKPGLSHLLHRTIASAAVIAILGPRAALGTSIAAAAGDTSTGLGGEDASSQVWLQSSIQRPKRSSWHNCSRGPNCFFRDVCFPVEEVCQDAFYHFCYDIMENRKTLFDQEIKPNLGAGADENALLANKLRI
ncbi:unnamed protein product, partial [Amoebophrya sp. A120]|eukprot:GSA120T00009245001.1